MLSVSDRFWLLALFESDKRKRASAESEIRHKDLPGDQARRMCWRHHPNGIHRLRQWFLLLPDPELQLLPDRIQSPRKSSRSILAAPLPAIILPTRKMTANRPIRPISPPPRIHPQGVFRCSGVGGALTSAGGCAARGRVDFPATTVASAG